MLEEGRLTDGKGRHIDFSNTVVVLTTNLGAEALTAKDRPYKKKKSVGESLTILGKFKLGGHVDPDLFDIFMWEKVYEKYAKEFLDPDQMDDIDPAKIPGYVPPEALRARLEGIAASAATTK